MKYLFSLSLFLFGFLLNGFNIDEDVIAILSIPKSGTNLLGRCISLLTEAGDLLDYVQLPEAQDKISSAFFYSHIPYSKEVNDQLAANNATSFYIYRDPRDNLVSLIYWMKALPNRFPKLSRWSFDELFTEILTYGVREGNWLKGNFNQYYRDFISWRQINNICVVKFEDLVGPLGGGDKNAQIAEIKKIAKFLNIELSDTLLSKVLQHLFGNRINTFREGQIGSWKKHFTKEHKQLFKKTTGDLLIELGYEQNVHW